MNQLTCSYSKLTQEIFYLNTFIKCLSEETNHPGFARAWISVSSLRHADQWMHCTVAGPAVTGEHNCRHCTCNGTDASCPSGLFSKESALPSCSGCNISTQLSVCLYFCKQIGQYISNHLILLKQSIHSQLSSCISSTQIWLSKQLA